VHLPNFLPHGLEVETFCKPGDIVCIDEAWRFWGTDSKLSTEHKIFFREHRHYVDPITKVSCDLVLMVQDIGDLHRLLKVVVELSFKTTKIKAFSNNSKTYRVEMWEGYKQTYKSRVAVENKRYSKEVFPLYSSYVGGTGKEMQVDGRQNVLSSPKFWIIGALFIAAGYWGVTTAMKTFTGEAYKKSHPEIVKGDDKNKSGGISAIASKTAIAPPGVPPVSEIWRITGSFQTGDKNFVVLTNPSGRTRLEHPSAFSSQGMTMVGNIDGERLLVWSGAPPVSILPGDKK
jgi:zona occludens toxin